MSSALSPALCAMKIMALASETARLLSSFVASSSACLASPLAGQLLMNRPPRPSQLHYLYTRWRIMHRQLSCLCRDIGRAWALNSFLSKRKFGERRTLDQGGYSSHALANQQPVLSLNSQMIDFLRRSLITITTFTNTTDHQLLSINAFKSLE